jgi:hypothetical protein
MRRLATVLNCDVATLAPELGGFAVAVGVAGERVALRPEPRSESAGR